MKYNPRVTSSRRKNMKAHLTAPSSVRRVIMSAPLSSDLRSKYSARSMAGTTRSKLSVGPTRGERVRSSRGHPRGEEVDGERPSKVVMTKLRLDKDRKSLLERKDKFTPEDVIMQTID